MKTKNNKKFQWAVVGAGPAGIAAVGRLLDNSIPAEDILWIDPSFAVGDLGSLWLNVSSNTKVKYFNDYLNASRAFAYEYAEANFGLSHLDPERTCILNYVVEPLQWISTHLAKLVTIGQGLVHRLFLTERAWSLDTSAGTFKAQNVILATGASPSSLHYPGVEVIPFEHAIDKKKLAKAIKTHETYAVFGSSHSAIIILRYLVDLGVKKIINFYRSPCRYAIEMGDWILFDNTGLKGETAAWARANIDGTLPKSLVRYNTTEPNIARYLSECDKVIYAVGFEKKNNIIIGDYENMEHNSHTGIIAPGLFGLGIAYPELKADPFGYMETQVGLWKFMVYLNKVLPIWLKYPC